MPSRPRVVRRTPISERLQAYLNPLDFLLWLSEELNSNDIEDTLAQWAVPFGFFVNIIFMVARANTKGLDPGDDVFADAYERRGSGWLAWFATFVVHFLTIVCLTNTFYTFWRRRHYRLFEKNINNDPNTPSAQRVRVDSSPASSSPLRYFSDLLAKTTAQARAHPDAARDVWELSIWDPTPACLRLFTLFSPGHVFVYWLFLPLNTLDPRPSVTVTKTLALNCLLTVQLLTLQIVYAQQAKDTTLLHKEVHNEYDTKYVHPATHSPVRDVATQCLSEGTPRTAHEVLVSTPKTYVNRGFRPRPNPVYAAHYDPDSARTSQHFHRDPTRILTPPNISTPAVSTSTDLSSPLRPTPGLANRQPAGRSRAALNEGGGYLGVHSHAQSPLRRQALADSSQKPRVSAGAGDVRPRSPVKRESSPLKRASMPDLGAADTPALPQKRVTQRKGDFRGSNNSRWWG